MDREVNDENLSENLTDDEVTKKVVGSPESQLGEYEQPQRWNAM
jgi:hypothetical protein